jgi:hypothetical protein
MKAKRNPSLETCRHGFIDVTCTKCWPNGNVILKLANGAMGKDIPALPKAKKP